MNKELPEGNVSRINEIENKIKRLNDAYSLYTHANVRGVLYKKNHSYYNVWTKIVLGEKNTPRYNVTNETIDDNLISFRFCWKIDELIAQLHNICENEKFSFNDIEVITWEGESGRSTWAVRNELNSDEGNQKWGISTGVCEYHIKAPNDVRNIGIKLNKLKKLGFEIDSPLFIWTYIMADENKPVRWDMKFDLSTGIFILIPNYFAKLKRADIIEKKIEIEIEHLNEIIPKEDLSLTVSVRNSNIEMLPPFSYDPLKDDLIQIDIEDEIWDVNVDLWWNKTKDAEESFVDKKKGKRPKNVRKNIMVAHECFDLEFSKLKNALINKDKDTINFEWGVSSLLNLCGFQIDWIGYKRGKGNKKIEEIDILAYLPNHPKCLAIECTIKEADFHKKISGISQRSEKLSKEIKDFSVYPIIFTNVENISSIGEIEKFAGRQGIVIVSCERIKELWVMARDGTPSKDIFDTITRWRKY
jgi:hypothetical protein